MNTAAPFFPFQRYGTAFLLKKKKAILADGMGLGKTRQAAAAAILLKKPTLVICPASLKINWAREVIALDTDANIEIINSGDINTITQYNVGTGSQWLIINYDLLGKYLDELRIVFPYGTIIGDEAHYIKSTSADRSKAFIHMTKYAENVLLLTGTPIMNRPLELYNLLRAISHPLGENYMSYGLRYCAAYWRKGKKVWNEKKQKYEARKFLDMTGSSNLEELRKKIQPIFLRRTKEILGDQLPKKIIRTIEVELDEKAKARYAGAWQEYLLYLEQKLAEMKDAGEADEKRQNAIMAQHLIELQKLKQICSEAKIDRVVDDVIDIVEQGEKIIVFTQYTNTLEEIKAKLKQKKIKAVSLSGSDNEKQKQTAIDSFQNDASVKVFVGNIQAAGVGITLTAATLVKFADMEWTPALHEQAEDRAHRIGQTCLVNVDYYVTQNTLEVDIMEALEIKKGIIAQIVDGKSDKVKNVNVATVVMKKLAKTHLIHT